MSRRSVALIVVMICLVGVQVRTWGGAGHHIISRIAYSQMTPEARQLVLDLLGDEDFVEISTWADRVRNDRPETSNWHFVNIPYAAGAYDPARDCLPTDRGDCVIAAIERARLDVISTSLQRERRTASLKFLVHFVQDMHQPLHTIGNGDRGGNDVATVVEGFEPAAGRSQPNLHAVWDSVLLGLDNTDEEICAKRLIERLRTESVDDGGLDVVKWSLETRDLAVAHVYTYRGFAPGARLEGPAIIDSAYRRAAMPVIEKQLMRAGVRLARMLNDAAARIGQTRTR